MEKDYDFLRDLLNNKSLLKWVRKFTAEGLKDDIKLLDNLKVKTSENSICISDSALIKMFVTNARYIGGVHVMFSLEQLAEIISVLGKEGKIIVPIDKNNPVMIEDENHNLIVLAPRVADDVEDDEKSEVNQEKDKNNKKKQ